MLYIAVLYSCTDVATVGVKGLILPLLPLNPRQTRAMRRIKQWSSSLINHNKKAVLPQGNRAMLQVFFSVKVRQQHSLQV